MVFFFVWTLEQCIAGAVHFAFVVEYVFIIQVKLFILLTNQLWCCIYHFTESLYSDGASSKVVVEFMVGSDLYLLLFSKYFPLMYIYSSKSQQCGATTPVVQVYMVFCNASTHVSVVLSWP